jgi:rod shape-determining protein MreC
MSRWSWVRPLKRKKHFPKLWISVFFIGLIIFLLSYGSGKISPWGPTGQLVIDITAPFQNLIAKMSGAVEGFWLNYFQLINVREENAQLKAAVDSLKMENSRYLEMLSGHKSLEKLLQFKQSMNEPSLAARVIGLDPTGWFKSVIIDKGEDEGVRLDMSVVNANGIVGRVVSVSPNYAKVLLIIDQNSAVDCLVQRSRERGIAVGLSTDICKLNYVQKSGDIAVGDIIVSSGLADIFPKGLPVGEVLNIKDVPGELFKDIDIRPAVDFAKLEVVLLIMKERMPSSDQTKVE